MNTVAVIDYGMGNLRSVAKALEHVAQDQRIVVSDDPAVLLTAERVVFPGVGAIRDCMAELEARGLVDVVRQCAHSKPFLGICLGLQALLDFSAENDGVAALGVLAGRVRAFVRGGVDPSTRQPLKIPHMGWNQVHQVIAHPLWQGIPQDSRFYFVHSYYVDAARPDVVAGVTHYGVDFASACAQDNIFAVQFHPEKSQQAGLTLLANFLRWDGTC
jgi:imidazole glycerol-phosphate synthase subunit HisH